MNRLLQSASLIALSGMTAFGASAQEADTRRLQAVTVTATKQAESAQSIPVTVTALGETELEQLGVKNFNDYLVQLPGVTAGGSGPGQSTIYIRGLASTTPNLTTAGVAGLAPNVALYLDEQPVSQPGRNLDVYAADLERVEVLSGPQGTLFGASSQAGTVRLITNKPQFDSLDASIKASTSFTEGGEMSNSVEAMLNLPVSEDFALRGTYTHLFQNLLLDRHPYHSYSESFQQSPQSPARVKTLSSCPILIHELRRYRQVILLIYILVLQIRRKPYHSPVWLLCLYYTTSFSYLHELGLVRPHLLLGHSLLPLLPSLWLLPPYGQQTHCSPC